MKIALILIALVLIGLLAMNFTTIKNLLSNKKEVATLPENVEVLGSFYDFKMKSLTGQEIDLSQYKGKKVVVMNVASKCGYTPQYADWQKFHKEHGEDIIVLGFPANNFGAQESGTNDEIASFCQLNYGVEFQMFEKIDVIGENQHPLFQWLSKKDLNGWNDKAPTWNFCKYVINEEGKVTHFFASKIKPEDAEFKAAVGL
ncbi:glutathione peroxidase [uncultured Arcticibacterium sp.]|mgnify:CR=1 FL=1|uniref:glutathione peroxidase n=1 Tax=uncultured Arcticibacterium sp. TaxID=2173042 RepID=UPI0030FA9D8E